MIVALREVTILLILRKIYIFLLVNPGTMTHVLKGWCRQVAHPSNASLTLLYVLGNIQIFRKQLKT